MGWGKPCTGDCGCGGCCQCADHVTPTCNDSSTAVCINGEWVCADGSIATCDDETIPTCAGCPCCLLPCYQHQETPRQYKVTGFNGLFTGAGDCSECSNWVDGLILTQQGCGWSFIASGSCTTAGGIAEAALAFQSAGDLPDCSAVVFTIEMSDPGHAGCPDSGYFFKWGGGPGAAACCKFVLEPASVFPGAIHAGPCCIIDDSKLGALTFTPIPDCSCGECCNSPTPNEIDWTWDWTGFNNNIVGGCATGCPTDGSHTYTQTKTTDATDSCVWTYSGAITLTATLENLGPPTKFCTWTLVAANSCMSLTYVQTDTPATGFFNAFLDTTIANFSNCATLGGNGGDYGGGGGGGAGGWANSNGALGGTGGAGVIRITYGSTPTIVTLTHASTSPWTVPVDWDNSNNKIELTGAGAGGNAGANGTAVNGGTGTNGGGGGEYASSTSLTYTIGATIPFSIPDRTAAGSDGGDTNWNSGQIIAKGGKHNGTGGTGGTGATLANGGAGGTGTAGNPYGGADTGEGGGSGGGGGAGGPHGAGIAGGNALGFAGKGDCGLGGPGDNASGGAGGTSSGADGGSDPQSGGGGAGADGAWVQTEINLSFPC